MKIIPNVFIYSETENVFVRTFRMYCMLRICRFWKPNHIKTVYDINITIESMFCMSFLYFFNFSPMFDFFYNLFYKDIMCTDTFFYHKKAFRFVCFFLFNVLLENSLTICIRHYLRTDNGELTFLRLFPSFVKKKKSKVPMCTNTC